MSPPESLAALGIHTPQNFSSLVGQSHSLITLSEPNAERKPQLRTHIQVRSRLPDVSGFGLPCIGCLSFHHIARNERSMNVGNEEHDAEEFWRCDRRLRAGNAAAPAKAPASLYLR